MRRSAVAALTGLLLLVLAPGARADCAADPTTISFHRMIAIGKTGEPSFPVMLLGRVVGIKDLGGGRGGDSIAKLAVGAHPTTAWAPLVARIPFYKPPPRTSIVPNLEFHRGELFVVLAERQPDRTYRSDGPCGRSRELRSANFHRLLDFAERQ
jgi:hypothetical protein